MMQKMDFQFHDTICRFTFNGFKTLLRGDSANGKTWVLEALSWHLASNSIPYTLYGTSGNRYESSMSRITDDEFEADVKKLDGGWVLIDRADLFLNNVKAEFIDSDLKNRYVIAGRTIFRLHLSPSNIAIVEKNIDENMVQLIYPYVMKGF